MIITRKDEMKGFGAVCDLGQEFAVRALAFMGESRGSHAMPAWVARLMSRKFSSTPDSTRASRGRDCWFQQSVALDCILGWEFWESEVWLTRTPTATGKPLLLAGRESWQGNGLLVQTQLHRLFPRGGESVGEITETWR